MIFTKYIATHKVIEPDILIYNFKEQIKYLNSKSYEKNPQRVETLNFLVRYNWVLKTVISNITTKVLLMLICFWEKLQLDEHNTRRY